MEGEQSDDRRQLTCLTGNMERNFVPLWSDTSPMLLDCRCCTLCSDAVDCLYYGSPYFIPPHQEHIPSNTVPAPINPKQWSRVLKRRQTLASSPNPNRRSGRPPVRARAKKSTSTRFEDNDNTRQKLQNRKSGRHDALRTRRMGVLVSEEYQRLGNPATQEVLSEGSTS